MACELGKNPDQTVSVLAMLIPKPWVKSELGLSSPGESLPLLEPNVENIKT